MRLNLHLSLVLIRSPSASTNLGNPKPLLIDVLLLSILNFLLGVPLNQVPALSLTAICLANRRPCIPTGLLCSRCLASGHLRVNCRAPIKCHACRNRGHVAAACPSHIRFKSGHDSGNVKGKAAVFSKPGWFLEPSATNKASSSRPPGFNSFGEMFKACFASWANKFAGRPWQLQPTSRP